ncbi:DUF4192 domain-containing protein [Rhodococcus pyridinivorans]|uniref:DUF4192 domain-containing protein n=1 Tax=Rhodococcus pyridinivorans TaxID=103816 RepID=UPI003AAD7A14
MTVARAEGFGSVIAMIPAMFGFVPEESIIAAALDEDNRVVCTYRLDIHLIDDLERRHQLVNTLARAATVDGLDSVVVVAVGTEVDARQARLSRAVETIEQHGYPVKMAAHIAAVGEGELWCETRTGTTGLLEDPAVHELAVVRAVEGGTVAPSRDELTRTLAASGEGLDADARPDDEDILAAVMVVYDAVDTCAAGKPVDSSDVQAVAGAILNPKVRDLALGMGSGDRSHAAIDLFADVARRTQGQGRVEALAVVAALTYMTGNGPLAGIAIAMVKRRNPLHRLVDLLDIALQNGIQPSQINEVLAAGATQTAAQLGIDFIS